MAELIFYERVAVLDREKHKNLKLQPKGNQAFAAKTHAVPLVAAEYADAGREYPIVFSRTPEGKLLSLAVTGVRQDENLFVDGDGVWQARYIPAFVRRYPFVFAATGEEQLTVCIDESYPGFGDKEGNAIFEDGGEPTPYMKGIFDLLVEYQRQAVFTENFLKKLDASGLLTTAELRAETPTGERAQLQGVLVVDGKKFESLPEATLKEWFASGELGAVYAHLFSLGNVQELARRLPVRKSGK